jgi:hypothetical protein
LVFVVTGKKFCCRNDLLLKLLFGNDRIDGLIDGPDLRIVSLNLYHPCIFEDESTLVNDDEVDCSWFIKK